MLEKIIFENFKKKKNSIIVEKRHLNRKLTFVWLNALQNTSWSTSNYSVGYIFLFCYINMTVSVFI